MTAPGNTYPAELLDARGKPVGGATAIQFTDASEQPGSGGGSQPGTAVVRKFPFAFNSPGISSPSGAVAGFNVYTPTIGDVLLDAWISVSVTTPFDGTTPTADVGTFVRFGGGDTPALGWFGDSFTNIFGTGVKGIDMTNSDYWADSDLVVGDQGSLVTLAQALNSVYGTWAVPAIASVPSSQANFAFNGGSGEPAPIGAIRFLPALIGAADPIKVIVSTDGTATGNNPSSTQGQGVLYLVTATPA